MKSKPNLLDLYCGAGGTSKGYTDAGFNVVGIDLYPQRKYPYEFHETYALDYLDEHWHEFDAIAASPPCQGHSLTHHLHKSGEIPDQVLPTQLALRSLGLPYIIENVPEAPLDNPVMLCGAMKVLQEIYPLRVYRHRNFESNVKLVQPEHSVHPESVTKPGIKFEYGRWLTVVGHISGIEPARAAMGIPWMSTREIVQAIPPAYTEYLGKQLLKSL